MMYGLDYLGGAKFIDLLVREHPAGWAAGFFANSFGNAWGGIGKLLATGRCPRVRIHAVWQDDHRYNSRRDDPVIMQELKRANEMAASFPQVEVEFSPFCEHSIKGAELLNLFRKVKERAGQVRLVNSVWTGDFLPASIAKNEVHGEKKAPTGAYNFSFDGLPCVDADVEAFKARHKSSDTFYFWTSQFNGRRNPDDKTPRPERKAFPTSQLIDSVIYLHRERGEAKLPRNYLWKSHADQHTVPQPEPRALKPVCIFPTRANRVELVASNGQVIAASSAPMPFSDGRFRYYFSEFGYVLAEKARRIHGAPTVSVRLGGKVVGTVNPAFRAGSFR